MVNNSVRLVGNLGDNPKITHTERGFVIANVSLATSHTYTKKDSNEKIKNTEWHKLVCYGKAAEILEKYTKKGSKIAIEGTLHTRQWEDNQGNKRYSTEVKVNDFLFLGGNSDSNSTPQQSEIEADDDDLPF